MGMVAMTVNEMPNDYNNSIFVKEAEKKKNRFSNKFIRADQVKISSTKYLVTRLMHARRFVVVASLPFPRSRMAAGSV